MSKVRHVNTNKTQMTINKAAAGAILNHSSVETVGPKHHFNLISLTQQNYLLNNDVRMAPVHEEIICWPGVIELSMVLVGSVIGTVGGNAWVTLIIYFQI